MRTSLLMSAALLGLTAGAAHAQNAVGSTQSPPSPTASSQQPQPVNSVPAGAATSGAVTPGANLGGTAAPAMAAPAMVGPATAGKPRAAMYAAPPQSYGAAGIPGRGTRRAARAAEVSADSPEPNAPPTSAYRGGAGSPFSNQASNTGPSNARSQMAPRLPDPGVANSPEALLTAAQRALRQGRTGAAQEALERAETRVLSRTTDPAMAGSPDTAAMVQHIGEARRALGARNTAGAQAAISAAMAAPVPPPGPTVNYVQPGFAGPPSAPMPQPMPAPRTY